MEVADGLRDYLAECRQGGAWRFKQHVALISIFPMSAKAHATAAELDCAPVDGGVRDPTLRFVRRAAPALGAGLLLSFSSSFGQTFFLSLFGGVWREAFDLSHGAFGALYAVATLSSAVCLLAVGKIVDDVPPLTDRADPPCTDRPCRPLAQFSRQRPCPRCRPFRHASARPRAFEPSGHDDRGEMVRRRARSRPRDRDAGVSDWRGHAPGCRRERYGHLRLARGLARGRSVCCIRAGSCHRFTRCARRARRASQLTAK